MWRSGCSEGAVLVALLLGGCGDPLAKSDYRGEPLVVLTGEIIVQEALGPEVSPSVAVLWSAPPPDGPIVETAAEVTTAFPSRYELRAYLPPTDEAIQASRIDDGERALGAILVFDDVSGDGVFEQDVDTVLGGSGGALLVWTEVAPSRETDRPEEVYSVWRLDDQGCPIGVEAEPEADGGLVVELRVEEDCGQLPDIDCDGLALEWGEVCPLDSDA